MRGIDRSLVDEVWREIATYPPGRADVEARAFLEGQRHAAEYLGGALAGQPAEVQRAAFGLVFLLFKVLERSLRRPFPELSAERIGLAHEATAQWLEARGRPAVDALDTPLPGHPTLVRYIVGVFYGEAQPMTPRRLDPQPAPDAPPAEAPYDVGVRARLTLVLRTLAAALDLDEVESG
jgi:hypothetical protein